MSHRNKKMSLNQGWANCSQKNKILQRVIYLIAKNITLKVETESFLW